MVDVRKNKTCCNHRILTCCRDQETKTTQPLLPKLNDVNTEKQLRHTHKDKNPQPPRHDRDKQEQKKTFRTPPQDAYFNKTPAAGHFGENKQTSRYDRSLKVLQSTSTFPADTGAADKAKPPGQSHNCTPQTLHQHSRMASVQMRRKGTNTNSPSAETHPEEQRFTPEVFTVQPRKGKGGNLCNLGIKDKKGSRF